MSELIPSDYVPHINSSDEIAPHQLVWMRKEKLREIDAVAKKLEDLKNELASKTRVRPSV